MNNNMWFVHIQGETFGPVSTNVISIMIKQNRLQFMDYVWTAGMERWVRIGELPACVSLMPPYPKSPGPSEGTLPSAGGLSSESLPPATSEPAIRQAAAGSSSPTEVVPNVKKGASPTWIRRHSRVACVAQVTIQGHGAYSTIDVGI